MNRAEKIYYKALSSTANVAFHDLCYLLDYVGFEKRKPKGTSHMIYKHPQITDIQDAMVNIQNDNGKAKNYQIKIVLDLIERYDLLR